LYFYINGWGYQPGETLFNVYMFGSVQNDLAPFPTVGYSCQLNLTIPPFEAIFYTQNGQKRAPKSAPL
jgi:hypothetical protein